MIAALVTLAPSARAQRACSTATRTDVRVAERAWPAPLDRRVTLSDERLTLRDGLARLAEAAHVKLSYVAELLPLDRATCLAYRATAAGDVLADLLRGTGVEPVVAGDDQVVLAPARPSTARAASATTPAVAHRASVLDRVVVTGTTAPHPQRFMPVSVDVIPRDRLARQGTTSLSQLLDGAVPGMWMWQQAPTTLLARYGSVRGASSFGVSYPKMYIDGIEVANPLLVRQLDASAIDRVEVVRGPQGAALYGADANSGVINIVTRHDGASTGSRLLLESTAGVSGSQFATQDVLTQQHALAFRTGTAERSGGFGLSVGTSGAYVPGAFARTLAANGDVRVVGAHRILTGTARVFSERAGSPANPLLAGLGALPGPLASSGDQPAAAPDDYGRIGGSGPRSTTGPVGGPPSFARDSATGTQAVSEYTVGGTLAVAPNDRWTHTIVLGVDGYRLANPALDAGPIPSAADSALAAAEGGSDRVTARLTSAARFGSTDGASTVLSFTAEHAAVREQGTIASMVVTRPRPGEDPRGGTVTANGETSLVGWYGNSGLVAQASTTVRNRLFLTAGMRLERDAALVGSTRVATLPMLAGSVVGDHGAMTLKLRAAYGESIRPVQGTIRELAMSGRRAALVAYDLAPERQGGVEVGADLFVGRTFGLHVTRFDQRATNLIQSVPVMVAPDVDGRDTRAIDDDDAGYEVGYQLQNVGAIANRGWELQSSATLGRLTLGATLALVDSRVARTGTGYSGELRVGDRMLDVPARTASLTGSWIGRAWSSTLTVARASDWMGYDRLAVASALTAGEVTPAELVGDRLRGFWREYDGVTRVRASFSRDLFRGLSLVFTGDNLLGQQRGEPDNATVIPGRTVTAGIRAKF